MIDAALVIRWGPTQPGREKRAIELFSESLRYFSELVAQGKVDSVEPFFVEPHASDLEGFWIVRGNVEDLALLRVSDDFQKFAVRAQAVVYNFGVIGATTGERLNKHMAWFAEAAQELGD
jgi:hypothetical protein